MDRPWCDGASRRTSIPFTERCHAERSEGSWQLLSGRNAQGASRLPAGDGITRAITCHDDESRSAITYGHDWTYRDRPVLGVNLHCAPLVQDDHERWLGKGTNEHVTARQHRFRFRNRGRALGTGRRIESLFTAPD